MWSVTTTTVCGSGGCGGLETLKRCVGVHMHAWFYFILHI